MKLSYKTKIVDVQSVGFTGKLEYAFTDDLAGWQIEDGSTWQDLDIWLEKFRGKQVKVSIELLDWSLDESHMLDDSDEEWRCYDLH